MFIQKGHRAQWKIIKPVDYYYYYCCCRTFTYVYRGRPPPDRRRPALRVATAAGGGGEVLAGHGEAAARVEGVVWGDEKMWPLVHCGVREDGHRRRDPFSRI